MRIDYIIVAYRSADDLPGCLDSIAVDAPTGSGTIVVDNASPDDSAAVAQGHPLGIRLVVSESNRGFSGGCNLGAAASQADAVFFLNPDARLCPGATSLLVKALETDATLGVVGPHVVDPTGQSRAASAGADPSFGSSVGHYLGLARVPGLGARMRPVHLPDPRRRARPDWVSGAAMLVRREAFTEVGGFDERWFMYMEDVDLCRRLRERGWAVAYEPEAVVEHRIGGSQSSDQAARWYRAYHAYIAARGGPLAARSASFAAAVGMGLRAVACAPTRRVNSRRLFRGAWTALRLALLPGGGTRT
jgi:GT2 family glycosyltransferase